MIPGVPYLATERWEGRFSDGSEIASTRYTWADGFWLQAVYGRRTDSDEWELRATFSSTTEGNLE